MGWKVGDGFVFFQKPEKDGPLWSLFYCPITSQKLPEFWGPSPLFTYMLILNFKKKRLLKNKYLCNLSILSKYEVNLVYIITHLSRTNNAQGDKVLWLKGHKICKQQAVNFESQVSQLLAIYTWILTYTLEFLFHHF